MRILLIIAPILCLLGAINSVDDNDLPIYLRGIGWRNVEEELRKNLRLSKAVHPIHYDLNLNVGVSGYDDAEISTFNGTVLITVAITAPVKDIELHSLGLNIKKAELFEVDETEEDWKNLGNGKFEMRAERETVVISSRRLLLPGETIALIVILLTLFHLSTLIPTIFQIEYNGTARMDGSGFYESWNHQENSSERPYISLLTHCEPARARRWFPCFDEPDMKATFQLRVSHPQETNAYSNTRALHSVTKSNGVRLTQFEATVPLPTYLFALAITEQPVVEMTEDGYTFRAIGYNRVEAVGAASSALEKLRNHSIFDGVPFFPEKTDILVVDDYRNVALENPGLITIDFNHSADQSMLTHELAHMYFGNLVTLSTWGDIWLNEGFAALFEKNLKPSSSFVERSKEVVSLHDLPLHSGNFYYSSIYLHNSFEQHIQHIHYGRASQFTRMIRKFVGEVVFDRAINKYLYENAYGNADASKIVYYLLDEYDEDKDQLKKMLYEWIYQPGVALLFMKREYDRVVLSQTRFTSTFYSEDLRDKNTRFTIPLFCEIDGKPKTIVFDSGDEHTYIPLSLNLTFTIENDYGELFGVWGAPSDFPEQFENIDDWLLLTENLFLAGIIDQETLVEAVTPNAEYPSVKEYLHLRVSQGKDAIPDERSHTNLDCESKEGRAMNTTLSWFFAKYLQRNDLSILFCYIKNSDREVVKEVLYEKIITDHLKIRSIQLEDVIKTIERFHPGASMEFAMDELLRDPSSLPLRLRMKDILTAVYSTSNDVTALHEFIRLHPSIAAESSDTIMQILERIYVQEEFERRDAVLKETLLRTLGETSSTETSSSFQIVQIAFLLGYVLKSQ